MTTEKTEKPKSRFKRIARSARKWGLRIAAPILAFHLATQLNYWRNDICNAVSPSAARQDFYEAQYSVASGLIGVPKSPSVKIFETDGEELRVYTTEFKDLKLVKDDEKGFGMGQFSPLEFKQVSTELWNRDYRQLAQRVGKESSGYSIMLIKTIPGMSDRARSVMVTTSFIPMFEEYHRTAN